MTLNFYKFKFSPNFALLRIFLGGNMHTYVHTFIEYARRQQLNTVIKYTIKIQCLNECQHCRRRNCCALKVHFNDV